MSWSELIDAARAVVQQAAAPADGSFLQGWPTPQAPRIEPAVLPVVSWLAPAVRAAPPGALRQLAESLLRQQGELSWRQTYRASQASAAFLDRYGWCQIFGPGGPLSAAHLACGVLLLGPETQYPAHRHRAAELYVPLSGSAWWQRAEAPFALRRPGEAIHHRPLEWHAMRTEDEPLLALYLWRGEGLGESAQLAMEAPSPPGNAASEPHD
ncbi:MAG TPA: dimethylsulfonioproprionate lyase family protein [Steroidobacteraceae bacterium]|nr:dimethylsulfonioproprionate lyase family protein [Steroidobacteraceae bacterium]